MRFASPLLPGRLIRRYKRFLADVAIDGGPVVTAHCPNPGAMTRLDTPGSEAWLSRSANAQRTLAHTLELVRAEGGLVGINTANPNAIVAEAIHAGRVAPLAGYGTLRREVRYGNSPRIDILLEDAARPTAYVEIKNVHLRRPDRHNGRAGEFPDCVTARGAKHLAELCLMVAAGYRAVMLYLVQRGDCDHFRVADDIDPVYAAGSLRRARPGSRRSPMPAPSRSRASTSTVRCRSSCNDAAAGSRSRRAGDARGGQLRQRWTPE